MDSLLGDLFDSQILVMKNDRTPQTTVKLSRKALKRCVELPELLKIRRKETDRVSTVNFLDGQTELSQLED